ncbi:MAG: protein jag [Ruminococcaceae bacterium]|nr:protein jag [Oscillospiraceae bacterium]
MTRITKDIRKEDITLNKEVIATGRTIEAAVNNGANELGVPVGNVEYEVLEQPKKGFLGFGEVDAKVRVYCIERADLTALNLVNTLLSNLGLEDAQAELCADNISNGDRMINITGESAGILIGHHGETLEALQYLCNLAANRKCDADGTEHIKMTLDIENYRERREATLRRLARGVAQKVVKYRKNITLEPMSPYERRIIHSELQNFKGVTTNSIGSDNNRRVVVIYENRRNNNQRRNNAPKAEAVQATEE